MINTTPVDRYAAKTLKAFNELANMPRDTFTSYVSRGQAPGPDRVVGRQTLYKRTTIKTRLAERPGRGHRADLIAKHKASRK